MESQITATREDMKSWIPTFQKLMDYGLFEHETASDEIKVLWEQCKLLIEKESASFEPLLQRVKAKLEESQTLRDGVSTIIRVMY